MVKLRLAVIGALAASLATLSTPAFAMSSGHVIPPPRPVQTCTERISTFAPLATPSDTPTDSSLSTLTPRHVFPTVHPTVNPQARCAPERFVVQLTQLGNFVVQNRVIASGPVSGFGSDDLAVATDTFDRFRLPNLFRAVNVNHDGIGTPTVYPRLCAVAINQVGRWQFNGGPVGSVFRNAIGNGRFLLTGQWVFPTLRDGTCSLRLIRGNPLLQNRIQPTYTNLQVWATGLARR